MYANKRIASYVLLLGNLLPLFGCALTADEHLEWSGYVQTELRTFPSPPEHAGQAEALNSLSIAVEPEVIYEWNNGAHRITARPFARIDSVDSKRSHFDIRELNWLYQGESWELQVGISKVFWGVSESRHLVDIINQNDNLEDIDEEEKLGQPMIHWTTDGEWGSLALFYLPAFRQREFTQERLRGPLPISSNPNYESDAKEWHQDWAIRYSHSFDEIDLGLSHFEGTSREPIMQLEARSSGPVLRPYYSLISQTGLDAQWTQESWLWKLESITREGPHDRFYATVAGLEYTFFQFIPNYGDLGILTEFLYDDRSKEAPQTIYEHDLFAGMRWSLEDIQNSSILAGAIVDLQTNETLVLIEAQRRLANNWLLEIEARLFMNTDRSSPAINIRKDDFISISLEYYF